MPTTRAGFDALARGMRPLPDIIENKTKLIDQLVEELRVTKEAHMNQVAINNRYHNALAHIEANDYNEPHASALARKVLFGSEKP